MSTRVYPEFPSSINFMTYTFFEMAEKLGLCIKELREQLGMSQKQLAKKTKLSLSYIQKLEQGQRRGNNLGTLSRIAAAFGVETWQLLR